MKFKQFLFAFLAFALTMPATFAQTTQEAEVDVTVFESVLSTATWANFKYKDELVLAKRGDLKPILKLLEFSGTVDGRAALDHSVTLLELIVSSGDQPFALAVQQAKPKLKTVLMERLQLAQGRTKKEELRKPLAEWAPKTWAAVNNKTFEVSMPEGCIESHDPKFVSKTAKIKEAETSRSDTPQQQSQQSETTSPATAKPKGKE